MIRQLLCTLSGSSLYRVRTLKTLTSLVLTVLVETLITARSILSVMKFSFQLPIEQSRRFHIDYPEILLMSSIVVAAKLCFPLGQHAPFLHAASTEQSIRFDWTTWHKGIQELLEASQTLEKEPSFDQVTVDQVASMTTKELDQYFAHIASTIDRKSEFIPAHQQRH
jgi:RNA polymerase I-specific transcription initiation factor RRN7